MGTISNAGAVTASDGASTAHVELSLVAEATTIGEGRWYYCIVSASGASNSPQNSDHNRGYRGAGVITYQWQVDNGGGFGNIGGGTTDPYNYTSAPAGVVTPGVATASDGTSSVHVALSIAGQSVVDGVVYDYQCIVSSVDASNTPQTSDTDTGYRTTGGLTYAWQRSAGDGDAGYGALGGATTATYNDTTAPAPALISAGTTDASSDSMFWVLLTNNGENIGDGDGRWYYCIVSAIGATPQDTTHNRGYRGGSGLITYQWQVSSGADTTAFVNIPGATWDDYYYTDVAQGTVNSYRVDISGLGFSAPCNGVMKINIGALIFRMLLPLGASIAVIIGSFALFLRGRSGVLQTMVSVAIGIATYIIVNITVSGMPIDTIFSP